MSDTTPFSIDSVRFAPERELIASLTQRFGLDVLVEHFVRRFNVEEAHLAVRKVQSLLDAGLPAGEIAVISPYSAQVRRLREFAGGK